ncbi:unnamed protein product [Schistosoma margrebowiei]|uniref:Uncharacterized protein n=1 Tax=Schistosoma margrebowiei TaxID=48269 RepID=A0A183LB88_9TREM|nr:unnamed protein product [Schistosoma margrebowiei]
MESKLKEKQQSNSLIIDENELKEYKSTAKQYDSIPIEEKANILKLKISSLKKIKDDQSIQLDQLTSMKTNEDKKLLLQNAQLQAKCQELNNQLSYFKENLSTERRQETLDPGIVLLGTRQQGVPVILRELVLPN